MPLQASGQYRHAASNQEKLLRRAKKKLGRCFTAFTARKPEMRFGLLIVSYDHFVRI